MTTETRTCSVCGKTYIKGRLRRTCGSAECMRILRNMAMRERHKRNRDEINRRQIELRRRRVDIQRGLPVDQTVELKRQPKPRDVPPIVCNICGELFTPRSKCNVICPSLACQKEHLRLAYAKRSKGYFSRVCAICGREFTTKFTRQTKCKSPECQAEYRRRRLQRIRKEPKPQEAEFLPLHRDKPEWRYCLMCDRKFLSPAKQIRRCPRCQEKIEEMGW